MGATKTVNSAPAVSVIIPARNEEACLADCLQSIISQSGVDFEVIVVDDHSTDHTREIAASFPDVEVIEAGPLPDGWTGKNNALTTGACHARGEWLLFTDADTLHLPGSLGRALAEAKDHGVDMLSYSPEQIAVTFWEMAVLPAVFAELARTYPPKKVSDLNSAIAAANGQYILIKRESYDAVGGHAAIAREILEDVALARLLKGSRRQIRFRYGDNAVRTRMYRNFRQLRDGWTKNLAVLFPRPGWLAAKILAMWGFPLSALALAVSRDMPRWYGVLVAAHLYLWMRMKQGNFNRFKTFLGVWFGMPIFAYLLVRSRIAHSTGNISWKGRTYSDKGAELATGH